MASDLKKLNVLMCKFNSIYFRWVRRACRSLPVSPRLNRWYCKSEISVCWWKQLVDVLFHSGRVYHRMDRLWRIKIRQEGMSSRPPENLMRSDLLSMMSIDRRKLPSLDDTMHLLILWIRLWRWLCLTFEDFKKCVCLAAYVEFGWITPTGWSPRDGGSQWK